MKNNNTIYGLAVAILVVSLVSIFLVLRQNQPTDPSKANNNVAIIDGKQIIEIDAKGGYSPSVSIAKADVPTLIKVKTKGTFDCSASLVIPMMKYAKNLPSSGDTLIDIGPQKAGSIFQGLCSMGMYGFEVRFE